MKVCAYCGRENEPTLTTCGECGSALTGGNGQPRVAQSKSSAICPSCGAQGDYKPALKLKNSVNLPALLVGGWLGLVFHNAGRKKRVQCNQCATFFSIATPVTKLSRVLFWLLVSPTIIVLLIFLILMLRNAVSH
jgi:hypothetical protein